MVSWVVLEEMKIPHVMETTPLRAYLRRAARELQSILWVVEPYEGWT